VNLERLHVGLKFIVLRALDMITVVIPPALPVTMTIGMNIAIGRLKRASIFCTNPPRVNIGGKIDLVVFDKTGTLSEDGLDVLGVHAVKGDILQEIARTATDLNGGLAHVLAACHSIKVANGKRLADPLELKMFEFTGFDLTDSEKEGGGAV